jgi:hypothetical protein
MGCSRENDEKEKEMSNGWVNVKREDETREEQK